MSLLKRIADKRADLAMLQEFRQLTALLADNLDQVGDQLETMKGGTESVAMILANWQNVIHSVSLASMGLMGGKEMPEALVRIREDEDEPSERG